MSSSAGLPDSCTIVIKNLRKGDGDRIKVFCQKRTKNLTGDFSVSLEKKNPPFEGASRMFIDYCSGRAAMQALDDIMAHLRDHCGVQRQIKPVAYIKGSDKIVKASERTSGKAEKTSPESSSESDFCLWVGNLPSVCTEAEIKALFDRYGPVVGLKHMHTGKDGSSACAFINYASFECACSALAALAQGLVFNHKMKLKGDAGHNLSFALDLLVRLDETVTRSLSFNECLSISRNQKSHAACWQAVARSAGLDVDKNTQLVSLSPGRMLTADERLAMKCRTAFPSKIRGKVRANDAAASDAAASKASTPEKSSEEKTFAQITKRVGYDCDDLWKSLSDDNLNVDSRHMCRPANPLIVELVCMHEKGVEALELAALLKYYSSNDSPLSVGKLKQYCANYPAIFFIQDDAAGSYIVLSAEVADCKSPAAAAGSPRRQPSLQLQDILEELGVEPFLAKERQAQAKAEMMLDLCNTMLQNPLTFKEERELSVAGSQPLCRKMLDLEDPVARSSTPEAPVSCESFANQAPHAFLCPISHQIMVDPVSTVDGYTYSRAHIAEWLVNNDTSPMTNKVLLRDGRLDKGLTANYALKTAIDQWIQVEPQKAVQEWLDRQPPPVVDSYTTDLSTLPGFEACDDTQKASYRPVDSPAACSHNSPKQSKPKQNLFEMTVEDVTELFENCKFDTRGVVMGSVDGPTLAYLYRFNVQTLTLPAPEGLGLTHLQVKARLSSEMARLVPDL